MAHVRFQTLSGRFMDVHIPLESNVKDMKSCVAKHWLISAEHQKLAVGDDVLAGYESVGTIVESMPFIAGPLLVTVITTQEVFVEDRQSLIKALVEKLSSGDSRVRWKGLAGLANVVDRCSQREVDFMVSHIEPLLQDGSCADVATKRAALEALRKVSPVGHVGSLQVALVGLRSHAELVRLTAVETIAALTSRGDEAAVNEVLRLLRKQAPAHCKEAAIMALAEIAKEESKNVMEMLTKLSDSQDECIRNAACDAVMMIIRHS
jgi:hypothetical protein